MLLILLKTSILTIVEDNGTNKHLAAMGKVRPICRSGLEANILRPYCGLLTEKYCHHGSQYPCHLLKSCLCSVTDIFK